MKATVSPIAQRIAFKLDGAMPFEALILTRRAQIPAGRREEWLRGLLLQGFQHECEALQSIQRDEQNHAKPSPIEATALQVPPAKPVMVMPCNVVSFAALRKVIG